MERHTGLSAATRRRQWILVSLLILAGVVNYLDRSALSIANQDVATEMNLSPGEMGFLLSAFAWCYGLAQLPAGALSDRFGPRRVLAGAMCLWSLAQILCGLVRTYGQFVAARVALGFGEAPMFTSGARAVVDWFPLRDRGVPLGLFNASSALAPALAPPLLTFLMLRLGWRAMFVAIGVAGLVVAGLWFGLYRDLSAARVSPADVATIRESDLQEESRTSGAAWLALLKVPATWAMMGGLFGVVYVTWLYIAWLPYYLERVYHLGIAETGFVATVPQAAGFLGGVLGGFVSDALAHRGMAPARSRKLPIVGGLVLAGLATAIVPWAGTMSGAVGLISLAMFLASAASSCAWALGATLSPPPLVATVEALQNIGGSVGGALAPLITGVIVETTHGFSPAFVLAGLVSIGSAVSYALVDPNAYRPPQGVIDPP